MIKYRMATLRENLVFQHKYCRSAETREKLIHHFMITLEAYEELQPWYSIFTIAGSAIRSKNNIIIFCVRDLINRIEYYPIFSAAEGLRLLHKWRMEVSPKLSAFTNYLPKQTVLAANTSLSEFINYSSLFMIEESNKHTNVALGFNNLYRQVCNDPRKSQLRHIYC